MSPADDVRRGANWSIEGVADISTTERKRVPQTGNSKDVGARQGAEQVSRGSKRSVGIARLCNRTPSMGQARQFDSASSLSAEFCRVSEAAGDMSHACAAIAHVVAAGGKPKWLG